MEEIDYTKYKKFLAVDKVTNKIISSENDPNLLVMSLKLTGRKYGIRANPLYL